MRLLQLLPVGEVDDALLEMLRGALAPRFQAACQVISLGMDPGFALHSERRQYHSSELLARMQSFAGPDSWRLLAVTEEDLYIPILTFVFGEAQMGGQCAIVSTQRLQQEFYGLPPDRTLLRERLVKEAVHELGHTLHLSHCHDYRCVMASSHAVEWIDIKEAEFCDSCHERLHQVMHRTKKPERHWWAGAE